MTSGQVAAGASVVGTSVGQVTVAVVEAYAELARRVLAGPARLGRTRMVAVDGPSGAGKSVFAARLADALAGLPGGGRPPVVRTDDLLDGWDDQLTFWPRLQEWVLAPLRDGRPGRTGGTAGCGAASCRGRRRCRSGRC